MATKKNTKDRSMFLRFNAETEGVIDRIKKLLGNRGDSVSDTEVVRRLIDEGALRFEITDQLGLHDDLEKLQKNPRLGLLNVQTRERAGELLTRAELVFISRYWGEAYSHAGVRRREWVRKEPVAALYKMLFWIARLQSEAGGSFFAERHADFFERWGKGGELVVPNPIAGLPGDRWVTCALAKHICQMLSEAMEFDSPIEMKRLTLHLGRDARQASLQVALYGYWVSHQVSVLDGPLDEPSFPKFLNAAVLDEFRVDPIQSGNGFSCGLSKTNSWMFSLNSWVEWLELNEVISQSLDGNWDARAGRFTLFSPVPLANEKNAGFTLDVAGVRLFFERAEFTQLHEVLALTSSDHMMLAFAERAKDIYGQI